MRPLYLELQAFGPYREKESINFDKLSQSGIFLIKGPTGSGKTTIFDAMTFALYGGSSGDTDKKNNGRNDLLEWRCNQADESTPTSVSLTFESDGKKYRFTRSASLARTNFHESFSAVMIDAAGNESVLLENPKSKNMTEKAVEILGLTKEQFRQVILLPQGQFEKFLVAGSKDKQEILTRIFDTEKWSDYVEVFYKRASERENALKDEKKKIEIICADCSLEFSDNREITSADTLSASIEELSQSLDRLTAEYAAFNGEAKQKQLNEEIALNQKFLQLHGFHAELRTLSEKDSEAEEKVSKLEAAEKVEALRPLIKAHSDASDDHVKRLKKISTLTSQTQSKTTAVEEAKKALENDDSKEKTAQLLSHKGELESKRSLYENLDQKHAAFSQAKASYETARKKTESEKIKLDEAKNASKEKLSEWNSLSDTAQKYRNSYYANIYGEIAEELTESSKCPVCGSTTHPEPAQKSPDSISKEQMEEVEKAAEDAKAAWEKAENTRSKSEETYKTAMDQLNTADTLRTTAETELRESENGLVPGIISLKDLEQKIAEASDEVISLQENIKKLESNCKSCEDALTTHNADLVNARSEEKTAKTLLDKAEAELEEKTKELGYQSVEEAALHMLTDKERITLNTEITAHNSSKEAAARNIADKEKELLGKTEPDNSTFADRQNEINQVQTSYSTESTTLKDRIARLQNKLSELVQLETHYSENIAEAESDRRFAEKLRGSSGIGLQRYVLGIMFNQVIGEANQMLAKVHNGRYQLSRSDEKGSGNMRGLELIAHDSRKPDQPGRHVSMLSGGEKFLVSLALSIGMSTVARNSGIKIEALFIDEGFGTLDDNSINDAISILEEVRKNSGMIGIISHVKLLEENFPTQVEILKTDEGSTIAKA